AVMALDRRGPGYLDTLNGRSDGFGLGPLGEQIKGKINWDPALRVANGFYDGLVSTMRLKDRADRTKQLHALEAEIKKRKAELSDPAKLTPALTGPDATDDSRGKVVGEMMMCLLLPAAQKLQAASERAEQIQRNLHVAFALGIYKSELGRYPKKLEELAPRY